MLQEILTLIVDNHPTQYYINFEKGRKKFLFQPTLINKTAPTFYVVVQNTELVAEEITDHDVARQAIEKVREILANSIFDKF